MPKVLQGWGGFLSLSRKLPLLHFFFKKKEPQGPLRDIEWRIQGKCVAEGLRLQRNVVILAKDKVNKVFYKE